MSELKPVEVDTSVGRLSVEWGLNRWIAVDLGGRAGQRQVSSRRQLQRMLQELGVPSAEAGPAAASIWRTRPKDAGVESARPNQELWRATGLPAWAILLILLGLLALFIPYRVAHLRGR
jgi:hypothetical protein